MKLFIVACVSALVGLAMAGTTTHSRGCYYISGRCDRECEEGTHAYALGCDHRTPEATCEEPNPVPEEAVLCDYSSCYCDPPTVRNKETGKCVPLAECPKKD